jgi:cation transport ATPase
LAAADVGIAVASATDLARLSADVVVLGADLELVPWLLAHARRVRRVARQSLVWAFAYNAVGVALAAAGALDPIVASLAMIGSSVAVVANGRRVARAVAPGGPRPAAGALRPVAA